ncbi:hypothetical protein Kpol_364p7 [Vanderwaltozyma polyspora DSM 70294]|uniref:MAGE domain-containing protein n=1 Tax=Vanderwaltozyma polyspora (strain ATCC 22028 / DSM 70294 / BCRC 21397 / CBS 2163 / NBRC 10782 / NRRL Y-8283 / UCD 57-17) TaxID=436907 RepID=A7TSC3_VANPO|nr:uncharacterized protein Kpol_364p7 [Vanderwaltozyma polyspora DSM 70294]EDO14835.1 hypothetical protein Kpol_364p7 [Vanderwaltozyma polyspora DSM 70294]
MVQNNTNREPSNDVEDSEGSSNSSVNPSVSKISARAVRFILSLVETQNSIINKIRLQKSISQFIKQEDTGKVRFDEVFREINKILWEIYGYELRGIPAKNENEDNQSGVSETQIASSSNSSKYQNFILLNKLKSLDSIEELRFEHGNDMYMDLIEDGSYRGDEIEGGTEYTISNSIGDEIEYVFKGIVLIVISCILFEKNSILDSELLNRLQGFGIPIDGTKIPILKYNVDELLKKMERRGYVSKIEEQSGSSKILIYMIGKRTMMEFDVESLAKFIQKIFNIEDEQLTQELEDNIKNSIGNAYKSAI